MKNLCHDSRAANCCHGSQDVIRTDSWGPVAAASLLLLLALGLPAAAQDRTDLLQSKTAEQFAEDAHAAENSPLFASDETLVITLRTDIEWIRDTRNDSIEVAGTLWFPGEDGAVLETPVEVRARGDFRLSNRNCNFPPLRLDFPRSAMDGTVFEGQDRLKLVTPCHDSRDSYQEYVLKEYLLYRTFGILTPIGNRVRLVEITYEDIEDDYERRTKFAFLIESDEQMAARNGAELEEWIQFFPSGVDGSQAVILSMFQYLIGNSDWSATYFHNARVIRHEDGRYLTVPRDFDFAGAVNARYASPPEDYPIGRVTDRYFRSYCRPELQFEPLSTFFNGKKAEIIALHEGFEILQEDGREEMLKFYEDFWRMMDDERRFDRQILRNCKNW